jgi:hypothetical protein
MIGALTFTLLTQSTIKIDVRVRKPISPYIYGVNFPDTFLPDWLKEWTDYHPFTFAREGGNRFTAYNWKTNASNAGNDYFNENDDYLGKSDEPGWTVSQFLKAVQGAGAAALITVPTLGWVSADKVAEMNGSKDVGKTQDYINQRFIRTYPSESEHTRTVPQPLVDPPVIYEDEFVRWVEKVKSRSTPVWFSLDNEPDLWSETHPRLQSVKLTYRELIANNALNARMIKQVAPQALVFGPVNYGWGGIQNLRDAPDANGRVFIERYLDRMKQLSESKGFAGYRLLDVYDFHWYPEATGDGVRITFSSAPDKPGSGPARIQAPRSLWDPTYVEKSWIADSLGGKPITLLPRIEGIIAKHYPGTKMAITEYDFGGRNTISGALAQADALGVFGRFGLFAACQWGLTHVDKAAFAGFEAFTNFDRKGGRFADLGLVVTGEDPAENSVYAALDSKDPKRMTLVAINKTDHPVSFRMVLDGFKANRIRSFLVADGSYLTPQTGVARLTEDGAELQLPALSIQTCELRSP